jgi:MerR family transcriptional regulator, repressor of the yfmOP operon
MRSATPPQTAPLLGIGEAAVRSGVSERALRYYQELGLITPSGCTPGGMRRYSEEDLARVAHLRELQTLLGFNLEEIKEIFANEDRLDNVRKEYREEATDASRRRELILEALAVRDELRGTVAAKIEALETFLADIDTERARVRRLLDEELAG